jgi:pyruvate dehydrogenase kinase 2/3/4
MNEDRLVKVVTLSGRQLTSTNSTQSANYVRTELPVRIAHRLRDLQSLPYVVVTQEGVAKVYEVRQDPHDCIRK